MFDTVAFKIVRTIDKAVPDKDFFRYGKFITPFGLCDIENLSTGCKTALLVHFAQITNNNCIISLCGAGSNALKLIFEYLSCFEIQYPTLYFNCLDTAYNGEVDEYLVKDIQTNIVYDIYEYFAENIAKEG